MKLPDLQIRIGIIEALTGVLTDVPIRDTEAGPNDALPYVLLSTQTAIPDSTKTSFGMQSTVLIQVVGKESLTVNRSPVETIMNTIMETLIPQNTADYFSVDGWQVCRVEMDSMPGENIVYEVDGVSVTKQLRLRISLREL